jgi:putative PIN family toxin of toxin-antitoxin system
MVGIVYDTAMGQRIVMDTNVVVSALRSSRGASHALLLRVGGADFEIALSVPLVIEYEDACKRMTRETGLTSGDIDDVIDYLCSAAHLQEIHFLWRPFLKDPRDDHVLELAVAAECEIIVTHNVRDFAGSQHFGVSIATPAQYLDSIGGTS